jgi:hypothetical protein
LHEFKANPQSSVSVVSAGRECLPVIVIDSFIQQPETLVRLATEAVFIDPGSRYPGVRAPVPQGYVDAMLAAVAPIVERTFGAPPAKELDLCAFSLVTTKPERLRAIQRIPHFDGPELGRLAFLHYLCERHQGGTSFYRHRATCLESVPDARLDEYLHAVLAELKAESPVVDYFAEDTRFFERVHRIDAEFNRLIVYKGNALHSGDISGRTILSEDPRLGRLTINGFGRLANSAAIEATPLTTCDALQVSNPRN